MVAYRIYMYTKGTGSGHLAQINAVFKGFKKANINCEFYASAYRSKFKNFLHPEIKLCDKTEFPPDIDIFICDWRADEFVEALPKSLAQFWVGLRRLGTMKSTFPEYYHVIAIEPNVKGDICIYPIINTFSDELKTREELNKIVSNNENSQIALLVENGGYPKHFQKIFNEQIEGNYKIVKCSNTTFSETVRDLSYYPIAELFRATDFLVIGGGYNSVHEAMCYANLDKTKIINVGGDDQALRIKKFKKWERKTSSESHTLALHIIEKFKQLHNEK